MSAYTLQPNPDNAPLWAKKFYTETFDSEIFFKAKNMKDDHKKSLSQRTVWKYIFLWQAKKANEAVEAFIEPIKGKTLKRFDRTESREKIGTTTNLARKLYNDFSEVLKMFRECKAIDPEQIYIYVYGFHHETYTITAIDNGTLKSYREKFPSEKSFLQHCLIIAKDWTVRTKDIDPRIIKLWNGYTISISDTGKGVIVQALYKVGIDKISEELIDKRNSEYLRRHHSGDSMGYGGANGSNGWYTGD